MTIKDIQEQLAHRLNSVEELIQGGCKAFAEDNRDVYDKAAEFVNGGGVAIVVVTPELARAADGDAEGMIPFEGDIVIQCIEKAPLTSGTATLRALDAAEAVVYELDGRVFGWKSTRQTADARNEVFTASVTFGYAGRLTRNKAEAAQTTTQGE